MPFHVLDSHSEPVVDTTTKEPRIFETGNEAAKFARECSLLTGAKHTPRAIVNGDWIKRERARFYDGTYIQTPWHDYSWFDEPHDKLKHFAHVARGKVGMVAYTENATKGAADICLRVRPGAYLTRFYADSIKRYYGYNSASIAAFIKSRANEFAAKYDDLEVKFATDADTIEMIYTAENRSGWSGPHSCMSEPDDGYDSPYHPVRVYAAGDLALAYITDPNNEQKVIARCLAWPEKKVFSRLYGDETRLKTLLEQMGYTFSQGSLVGARLTREEYRGHLVCPYIDFVYRVQDDGKNLTIATGGNCCADSTCGLIASPNTTKAAQRCGYCGNGIYDEDDESNLVDGVAWCESCYENHTFYCDRNQVRYSRGNVTRHYIRDLGQTWSQYAVEGAAYRCGGSGYWYSNEHGSVRLDSGVVVSPEYAEENTFVCSACNRRFNNTRRSRDNRAICVSCPTHQTTTTPQTKAAPTSARDFRINDRIRAMNPYAGNIVTDWRIISVDHNDSKLPVYARSLTAPFLNSWFGMDEIISRVESHDGEEIGESFADYVQRIERSLR